MGTKKNPYASENELCEAFAEAMKEKGWRAYPETSGFDLLLVATKDVKRRDILPGDQIGIEAKMRANVEVLYQAVPKPYVNQGPNFHAVLVPAASRAFEYIARSLEVVVFKSMWESWNRSWKKGAFNFPPLLNSYRLYYEEPCWYPDADIWVPPGVSSPITISKWKIKAMELCLAAEAKNGEVTSQDFRAHGVAMARWVQCGWIKPTGNKRGRYMLYRLDPNAVNTPPHKRWPEIFEAVRKMKSASSSSPLR